MAKRKYERMSRNKIEPAVQTVLLSTPVVAPGATGSFTVDISQIASLMNRRFYRQGLNWAVAGIKVLSTSNGTLIVKKLPNTWVMSNAWEKSFRAWQRMNKEALQEAESVRPRFLDFKIYADSIHHSAGYAANLLPLDGQLPVAQPYTAGEWEPSEVYTPNGPNFPGNTTNFELIATGANFPGAGASGLDAVSLIEGYAASRGLPNIVDPNTPDDALDADGSTPENWLSAMFNEGTDRDSEVLEDMITKNNLAPYPFENDGVNLDTMYPGGANQATGLQIHDFSLVTSTTIGGITHMKGGNFPCGLMRFDFVHSSDATDNANLAIQLDLMPGNHRGYLAEPMTEM
jgi:hypothetical protein